ncbi:helix-turn-helix domain-containing protein [Streptomyces endophytica]|uniref:Helix-turn-helix domain-containing protein n=1 Tax=Streptomyces endophytica TaxID=2991496 RepID=A0ABY6PI88_9ACTN|nr:helix-turn-helix domain-containing protein [Streptomyces endophytica]UZJ33155.1 helix-turn-helix domain-containing protein [Streptomyces endophytica]
MASSAETFRREPWHELPVALAALIRPRIDAIVTDMVEAIREEVSAYRRPLDSAVGRDLLESIRRALRQFAELTEHPDSPQDHHIRHFRHLGRVEFLNGRTTDGLQAAFRVGARVGSRRYAELVQEASLPPQLVVPLHEAVLIHINALSNEAVQGFLAAQLRSEDELKRARRTLVERLLEQPRGGGQDQAPLGPLASRARWPLPRTVACVVVRSAGRFTVPGADTELLTVHRGSDAVLVVPEPETGGLLDRVRHAARGRVAAVGPAVAAPEAWLSLQCARLALDHRAERAPGAEPDGGVFLRADEELADLHLLRSAHIGLLLGRRVLGAFAELPRGRAVRLAETLDALLMSWGRTAPEVAQVLGIHPQTARKRLRQLDELFGDRLGDPHFRFEAQIALRTHALRRNASSRPMPAGARGTAAVPRRPPAP